MSRKLFVSTSFSAKVDDAGYVLPTFRAEIESILSELRKTDEFDVYCAVEAEGWKISDVAPEVGVEQDLKEVDKSDAVLVILGDKPSWGVQYELGYAVAKGKPVIAATSNDISLSYFNQGLSNLNQITHIIYGTPRALSMNVTNVLIKRKMSKVL